MEEKTILSSNLAIASGCDDDFCYEADKILPTSTQIVVAAAEKIYKEQCSTLCPTFTVSLGANTSDLSAATSSLSSEPNDACNSCMDNKMPDLKSVGLSKRSGCGWICVYYGTKAVYACRSNGLGVSLVLCVIKVMPTRCHSCVCNAVAKVSSTAGRVCQTMVRYGCIRCASRMYSGIQNCRRYARTPTTFFSCAYRYVGGSCFNCLCQAACVVSRTLCSYCRRQSDYVEKPLNLLNTTSIGKISIIVLSIIHQPHSKIYFVGADLLSYPDVCLYNDLSKAIDFTINYKSSSCPGNSGTIQPYANFCASRGLCLITE